MAVAAGSTSGSGNHVPTYCSRRTAADFMRSRQRRETIFARCARGFSMTAASTGDQRRKASCTASSASAIEPSIRYATPRRNSRWSSNPLVVMRNA